MHSQISRIILFHPHLLFDFIHSSKEICDYIYEDPYDHLSLLDLKHKYLKNSKNNHSYVIECLDNKYCIFDNLRTNPKVIIHNDKLCLQFDSKYEILRKPIHKHGPYLKKHPEFMKSYINQCFNNPILREKFNETFIKDILTYHNECIYTDIVFPDYLQKIINDTVCDASDHSTSLLCDKCVTGPKTFLASQKLLDIYFYQNYTNFKKRLWRCLARNKYEYISCFPITEENLKKRGRILDVYYSTQNNKKFDVEEVLRLKSVAKSFITKYGGIVTGSAALAFYNLNIENCTRNFMPNDVDIFLNDKKIYDKCLEIYSDTLVELEHKNYKGMYYKLDKVVYITYQNVKINLILVNHSFENHVNNFDIEFCRLIWDGNDFRKSSNIALASAEHGKSYYVLNDLMEPPYHNYERVIKYENRGYKFVHC